MKFFIRSFLFVRIHRANAIVGYHKWNWIATSEMVLWELSHLTCDNVIPIMAVYFHSTAVLGASREFLKQLSKKTHPRNDSVWIKDLFKCHRWSITTQESHPQSQQWKIRNMRKTFCRQTTIMCDEKHLGPGRLRLICLPRIALCCLTRYIKVHVDSVHLA